MREIIFRGKRKDNDAWVYGDLVQWSDGVQIFDYDGVGKVKNNVIPETVGQYTGLEDKNGKKIFEGDIVAGALIWQEKRKNGLVAFKDGSFGLMWYRGGVEQVNAFTSMCNVEYEVIGNIHDNPELLKGSAEQIENE